VLAGRATVGYYSRWKIASVSPSGSLNHADFSMPGVVAIPSTVFESREVVSLEGHTAPRQLIDVGLDVGGPEAQSPLTLLARAASPDRLGECSRTSLDPSGYADAVFVLVVRRRMKGDRACHAT
jgi:hypothetical protein